MRILTSNTARRREKALLRRTSSTRKDTNATPGTTVSAVLGSNAFLQMCVWSCSRVFAYVRATPPYG